MYVLVCCRILVIPLFVPWNEKVERCCSGQGLWWSQQPCREPPAERSTWRGTEGGPWLPATEEPKCTTQCTWERMLPSWAYGDCVPAETSTAACESLSPRGKASPEPQKPWTNKYRCSEPLHFGTQSSHSLTPSKRQQIHSPVRLSGVINQILCAQPMPMPGTPRNVPRI